MIIFEKSTFQGKNKSKLQFDDERVIVNKIFSLFTTNYSNILLFFSLSFNKACEKLLSFVSNTY